MGLSLTSFAVSASLGIASLILPQIAPIAITATAFTVILGGKSLKDMLLDYRKNKIILNKLSKTSIGIVLKYKKDSRQKI